MTVYLYAKQHRVTGLRYFGKTTRDPHRYVGSGLYWRKHIKKHGKAVDTILVEEFTDQKLAQEFAEFFTDFFDIVNDDRWANLIPEDAKGGGRQKGCKGTWAGKKRPEHAEIMSVKMQGAGNPRFGKDAWNKGLTGTQTGPNPKKAHPGNQFGKGNLGKIQDAEWRRKKSEAAKANWAKRKAIKEQM